MQQTQRLSYRHRVITDDDLVFIRRLIAEQPGLRAAGALSKKLCEAWNWVQANGALRDMVCRGMMLMLHREGLIELPPVRRVRRNPLVERSDAGAVSIDETPLSMSLAELGPLEVRQVRRTPEEALFNSLLQQHHYLGYSAARGRAPEVPGVCRGPADRLRGVELGAASSGQPRSLHRLGAQGAAGQHPAARVQHAVPDPAVGAVPHLASHLLGRMARVLSADWQRVYGHPIYFLETFVDPQRFRGTCYRAANWIHLGVTTGRGKDAPTRRAQPLDQGGAGLSAGQGLPPAAVAALARAAQCKAALEPPA